MATFNFFGGMDKTYLEVAVFVKLDARSNEGEPLSLALKKASSEEPAFV
jgi:hypothetical protein